MPVAKTGFSAWQLFWENKKGEDFKHSLNNNKQNPLLNGEDFA